MRIVELFMPYALPGLKELAVHHHMSSKRQERPDRRNTLYVNGGPRGDLLVEVQVTRHPIFQRQDMNIFSTAPITFAQAALGGDVKISTVDGDVLYTVKPGTQTDTKIRLKGKGVPSLRNSNVRGDHYVTLVVQTPTKLNEKAKEALRAFDEACGNRPAAEAKAADGETAEQPKKKKGFMDKVKEAFEDIDK